MFLEAKAKAVKSFLPWLLAFCVTRLAGSLLMFPSVVLQLFLFQYIFEWTLIRETY